MFHSDIVTFSSQSLVFPADPHGRTQLEGSRSIGVRGNMSRIYGHRGGAINP